MLVCKQCGHENPAEAQFCNFCAAPVLGDSETPRQVRKTVTVLFCDVVGSTELGERFDPEVMRRVMATFYAAVREPVERHGGTVEKVIGDALVAVFGIPVVNEDDALRAVRAALEMRDAVRAIGEVQARIGVNTGDVLAQNATAGESLMVGDAVNVAARLEQAAAPGEVLVGEATWALVRHAAAGDRVEPIVAKGKREPLLAWRLDRVDPAAGAHLRRLDLPMIGRDIELGLLRGALARAEHVNRPHLVAVFGEPGIGKSRLVSEVAGLTDDLIVLTGSCRSSTSASSLEPLREITAAAFTGWGSVSDAVANLMPDDPDASAVAACLAPTSVVGVPDMAWAVSHLLGAMSSRRPVAIVLEDVHWADDLLLDVVEQLMNRNRRGSLLVVLTARPELLERRPALGAGSNTISLSLERLNDAQTRRLLAYASPSLAADRADHVVATAEGNPLFAEHLAALVGDSAESGGLPRSIQVLLTARLEALPQSERDLVSVAAVAGRVFAVRAVESILGRPVTGELDLLAQRELIEPSAEGDQQFAHALLQEAAYGLIPKQRRSVLHAQLARWLAEDGAGDAIVGDHLERAFLLRSELGMLDDATSEIGEEAGMRLAAAGRRADATGDPHRARRLLERALVLLPKDSPGSAAAMVELAAAGWNILPLEEIVGLLDTGAELAAQLGLRALELRARMLRLGTSPDPFVEMPEEEVTGQTDAALKELGALDDPRALSTVLCTRAQSELWLGHAGGAAASALRAVEILRAADEDTVWALEILNRAVTESPMPVAEGETLLARLMEQLGARPTVRWELIRGQAILSLLGGRPTEAWSLLDAAERLDQDLGRGLAWHLSVDRVRMLVHAGRYGDAQAILPGCISEMERRGGPATAAVLRSYLGLAEVRLGNIDDARAAAEPVLSRGYEAGTRAHLVLAEVSIATGRVDTALQHAREATHSATTGDWVMLGATARLALARTLRVGGDALAADVEARTAASLYGAKGDVAGVAEARAFLDSLTSPGISS